MTELRKAIITGSSKIEPDALGVLNIVRLCETYHSLPRAGGLLDQDSLMVKLMFNINIWTSERAELDRVKANRATTLAQ